MKIITVTNIKGGSGKSQAAVFLAWHAAQRYRVAVLDLDPNHQSKNWIEAAQLGIDVEHLDLKQVELEAYVQTVRESGEYDYLVIDTPANDQNAALESLMVADVGVIPIGVGTGDIGMLASTERQVRRAQQVRQATHPARPLIVRALLNRADFAPAVSQRTREAIEAFGLEVFQQQIPLRAAYQDANANPVTNKHWHYGEVMKEIYGLA